MEFLVESIGSKAIPDLLRGRVEDAWDRFVAARGDGAWPWHPEFRGVLQRVWACSDFVAQACIGRPNLLEDLCASGDLFIEYDADRYARRLERALAGVRDEDELSRILRREREREMVRIAWRDLAGWAGLEQTLGETSWLAEAAIDGALRPLERWAGRRHGSPRGRRSGQAQALAVLGMGKLGAFELNFSSDVDLICAYGEEGETRGRSALSNEEFFSDVVRRLVGAIGRVTEDGFVFRVDLRLRPYGDSGPLAMSFGQMEEYYQLQGREWERYAMIKARPVAGDRITGWRLLKMLGPFVYRRYLDFGVFESLREMKALIEQETARKSLGDDIKLGAGGIREVEFIGQAYQLVRGGREPALRERGILAVLSRLADHEHLPRQAAVELCDAYRFLRRVENRLQMVADRQTHRLPEDEVGRVRLAWSMGFTGWAEFLNTLNGHRDAVRRHFDRVFAATRRGSPQAAAPAAGFAELWRGTETSEVFGEEAVRRLAVLRDSYLYRALSENGRTRLDRLMPLLLETIAGAERPGDTLIRVLGLIEQIARRTVYLALLTENPTIRNHMVQLCAASPWIARMLGEQPLLLDELIDPRSLFHPQDRTALEGELAARLGDIDAADLEQTMDALRHFKQASTLRVAAADVVGAMPLMVVSNHLSDIAEVVLDAVLRLAGNKAVRGATPAGFCIVAYGKLGGIELGYGSDLDLVFLHTAAADEPSARAYPRLAQRIVHLLTAHTAAGVLYEIDLRLRPSGGSGLLVSSIDGFDDYQRHQAWTWEHQALVRARAVAGDAAIARRFSEIRADVLGRVRDPETLRTEVRDMRERMLTELSRGGSGRFDLKQDRGGIADIEFLVQYAVLRWAHEHPALLRWTDNIRLLETLEHSGLFTAADTHTLTDCFRMFRARVHRLALQEIKDAVVDEVELAAERAAVTEIWERMMEEPL